MSDHWFTWAKGQRNHVLENFNNHMRAYNHGRPSWIDPDFYPLEEYLFKQDFYGDPNTQPVTLVDVGEELVMISKNF